MMKMKSDYLYVLAGIVAILILVGGCATKPHQIGGQLIIKDPFCEKLLSVKNDGSMPKDSPVQRYEVVCKNKGQITKRILEITVDKKHFIKEANFLDTTRAMRPSIQIAPIMSHCEEGEKLRCARVCEKLNEEWTCYLICWCSKY